MEIDHKTESMEEVAVEKLMEMVMEVVVTKDVDIIYNYI